AVVPTLVAEADTHLYRGGCRIALRACELIRQSLGQCAAGKQLAVTGSDRPDTGVVHEEQTERGSDGEAGGHRAPLGPRPLSRLLAAQRDDVARPHWRRCSARRRDETVRHRFLDDALESEAYACAQRLLASDACRDVGIRSHRRLDFYASLLIELPIHVRHQCLFRRGHEAAPVVSDSISCNASRPRARRLVRVPIGISITRSASL